MKKKWLKKGSAVLLATTMVLSLFPGMTGTLATVQAAENVAPTSGYWTDAAGLKGFSLDEASDTVGKIIFGQNGSGAAQQWKIAGTDTEIAGDNIMLFADKPLGTSVFENDYQHNKSFSEDWNCTYSEGTSITDVYPNHYGASDLRSKLQEYASSSAYFSFAEQGKMNNTTIYTDDTKNSVNYTTTDKLYAPYGDYHNNQYVTVGTNASANLNGGVKIDISKWGDDRFWLRSPLDYNSSSALVAVLGYGVSFFTVSYSFSVVPALNLNLSSVIFASAADAASSTYTGDKANSTMAANTYTLRYAPIDHSWDNVSAEIRSDGTSVAVNNANGKYLMVQNSAGVYAAEVSSDSTTINASTITIAGSSLTDFNNCKVWIESTDDDRITTAKLATWSPIESVAITDITEPTMGSALDTTAACATTGVSETAPTVTWNPSDTTAKYNTTYTASVTLKSDTNYRFTDATTATINDNTATSVKKNEDGTLTVTYQYDKTPAMPVGNQYFATVDDLKDCYDLTTGGTVGKIRFGMNGKTGEDQALQEWKIVGKDTGIKDETGNVMDNIVLFADTPLGSTVTFNSTTDIKEYDNTKGCTYATNPDTVYANHYGLSDLRQTLLGLQENTSYFSSLEQDKMNSTTITTNDTCNSTTYTTNDKLYAAYGDYDADQYITVGTNSAGSLNGGLRIDIGNWGTSVFWLRSPDLNTSNYALVASLGDGVGSDGVDFDYVIICNVSVVPAFDLNLSSVIFASAADAASSSYSGDKANRTMTANTYTLRYASNGSEAAVISADQSKVKVTGANGKYLMIQNSAGVYAVAIDSETKYVKAKDITIDNTALVDFTDCKVWVESTDNDRITTAKEATQGNENWYDVKIMAGDNMTISSEAGNGAASQTGLAGAMTDVVYTANDGYYFPTDYSVTAANGISVTRNSYTQITVSGTPSATTDITLTVATEKATQSAPTGLSDGVDKIAGTTTVMEYASSANVASWNACSDGNTTVAAGTWYVRLKETDTKKASTATSIAVTPTRYQVTVNNGIGDGNYIKGATITITADVAPSGKEFDKWTVASGGVILASETSATTTFTMPASAVEVTATYKEVTATYKEVTKTVQEKTYTIKYKLNKGTNNKANPSSYSSSKAVSLKNPTRKGYTFSGWYTDSKFKNKITTIKKGSSKNYTLYAKWSKVTVKKAATPKLSNGKGKKMTVKYAKISGVKGYEITYAVNSKFTKGKKSSTTTKKSKTFTKLKKGSTYYVRVRAYKVDSVGKKVYGKYSAVKKIKITK